MKNMMIDVLGVTYCTVQYVHSAQYNRLTNLNENLIPSSVFRALAAAAAAAATLPPSLSLSAVTALLALPGNSSILHFEQLMTCDLPVHLLHVQYCKDCWHHLLSVCCELSPYVIMK
jgi:hypothetical protein